MLKFSLSYRKSYYLLHPWEIAGEIYRHYRWFIQRGSRGWADCDVWSLDNYLAGWVPDALDRLLANKLGHPIGMTRKGWDTRLKRMKEGFVEANKIGEFEYTGVKECKAAQRRMKRGLYVFVEHFLNLWD